MSSRRISLLKLSNGSTAPPTNNNNITPTNPPPMASTSELAPLSITTPRQIGNAPWSIDYKGTVFTGVCTPLIEPFTALSGYLAVMLNNMTPSSVPSRIEDVNNLVAIGLEQLNVTPDLNVGEVENILAAAAARPFKDLPYFPSPPPDADTPSTTMEEIVVELASEIPLHLTVVPLVPAAPAPVPIPIVSMPPVPAGISDEPIDLSLSFLPPMVTGDWADEPIHHDLTRCNSVASNTSAPSTSDQIDGHAWPTPSEAAHIKIDKYVSTSSYPQTFPTPNPPPLPLMSLSTQSNPRPRPPTPGYESGPRNPPQRPPMPRGHRREVTHITDDNTYGEARLAYARGAPTTSPLYGRGSELRAERAFASSFPSSRAGVWQSPTGVLPVIAYANEELSLLTVHTIVKTSTPMHFNLIAASGDVVSTIHVLAITPETDLEIITAFISTHALFSITPLAAGVMVRAKLTDGIFSRSTRRIVMGIDPIMIHMDRTGVELWNILTQHRLNWAHIHASATLRDLISFLMSPWYAARLRWYKTMLPSNIVAACEAHTDPSATMLHLLNSDSRPGTVDPLPAVDLLELSNENKALSNHLTNLENQLQHANMLLEEIRQDNRCDEVQAGRALLKEYLSQHTCINTKELPYLKSHLGVDEAAIVQSARLSTCEIARESIQTKAVAGSMETIATLQSRCDVLRSKGLEQETELKDMALNIRANTMRAVDSEKRYQLAANERDVLASQLAETIAMHKLKSQHDSATVATLQTTIKQNLPTRTSEYGAGQFAYPPAMPSVPTSISVSPDSLFDM
ncbi:nonstructural protein [Atlantic halibut reovirus]|nr:nonstructural protein [Atlantic halibut reovirus]